MENEKMERQTIETEECQCCRHKATPRNKEELRQMQNRLKRMIGQLNGCLLYTSSHHFPPIVMQFFSRFLGMRR